MGSKGDDRELNMTETDDIQRENDESPGAAVADAAQEAPDGAEGADSGSPAAAPGDAEAQLAELAAERDRLQAEQRRVEQNRMQFQAEQAQLEMERQAAELVKRYQDEGGFDPATAQKLASTDLLNAQLVQSRQREEQMAKQIVATRYANDYVTTEQLMSCSTPQEMESMARTFSGQAKEIANLKAQVAKMQQGAIPTQRLETGQSSGVGMSGDALDQAIDEEQADVTAEWARDFSRRNGLNLNL